MDLSDPAQRARLVARIQAGDGGAEAELRGALGPGLEFFCRIEGAPVAEAPAVLARVLAAIRAGNAADLLDVTRAEFRRRMEEGGWTAGDRPEPRDVQLMGRILSRLTGRERQAVVAKYFGGGPDPGMPADELEALLERVRRQFEGAWARRG